MIDVIKLCEGDVVVYRPPKSNLSIDVEERLLDETLELLKTTFPGNSVLILQHNHKITILKAPPVAEMD